ncbi:MAG: 30S ribosomal protein S13 [Candidatus Thorarchaeota archaeon]|nr:30S ribosomal protein S13 [Candidatus Thorarchaeota archaeon]
MSEPEYRYIVRVMSRDIDGQENLLQGLTHITGVGLKISRAVLSQLKLNPASRMGYLSDADIARIEELLQDVTRAGFPDWYVNRPRDRMTGKNVHLTGADLDFIQRNDIDRMKRMRSWRGIRHSYGLRVRGQHTKTTGRGGPAVGVSRKKD